jgi:hypothetical protein
MLGAFTAFFRGLEQPGAALLVHHDDTAIDNLKNELLLVPGALPQAGRSTVTQMKFTHGDANTTAQALLRIDAHAPGRQQLGRPQQLLQGLNKPGKIWFMKHRAVLGSYLPGEQKFGKPGTREPALATVGIGQKLLQFVSGRH